MARSGRRCDLRVPPVPVETAQGVPSEVDRVRGLRLMLASDAAHREIWHGLMASEHPRGTSLLEGCKPRPPVGSDYGWLDGVEMAASALHLSARNCWIGRDAASATALGGRLSRLLIRPGMNLLDARTRAGANLKAANWRSLGGVGGARAPVPQACDGGEPAAATGVRPAPPPTSPSPGDLVATLHEGDSPGLAGQHPALRTGEPDPPHLRRTTGSRCSRNPGKGNADPGPGSADPCNARERCRPAPGSSGKAEGPPPSRASVAASPWRRRRQRDGLLSTTRATSGASVGRVRIMEGDTSPVFTWRCNHRRSGGRCRW